MKPDKPIWDTTAPLENQTVLAEYVQESLPEIHALTKEAEARLGGPKEDRSFDAYVSRNPSRVRKQVKALYDTLRARELTYRVEPPGPHPPRQQIRLPATVLAKTHGHGCCVDLVLLLASALYSVRLFPLVLVVGTSTGPTHAVLAYWIEESGVNRRSGLPTPVLTWAELQPHWGKLECVECTDVVGQPPKDFAQAQTDAATHLAVGGSSRILYAVDVHACRRLGIQPRPTPPSRKREVAQRTTLMLLAGGAIGILACWHACRDTNAVSWLERTGAYYDRVRTYQDSATADFDFAAGQVHLRPTLRVELVFARPDRLRITLNATLQGFPVVVTNVNFLLYAKQGTVCIAFPQGRQYIQYTNVSSLDPLSWRPGSDVLKHLVAHTFRVYEFLLRDPNDPWLSRASATAPALPAWCCLGSTRVPWQERLFAARSGGGSEPPSPMYTTGIEAVVNRRGRIFSTQSDLTEMFQFIRSDPKLVGNAPVAALLHQITEVRCVVLHRNPILDADIPDSTFDFVPEPRWRRVEKFEFRLPDLLWNLRAATAEPRSP